MESIQFSGYDFVIIGIILLFVIRGIWIGLLKQIIPFVALYFGYFAASRYHDHLFPFLSEFSENPKVIFLSSYVILFVATFLVATLLAKALSYVIQVTITPWFDRILGAVLGTAKALIVVVLVHIILGTLLAPDNDMLRTCATCPQLNQLSDITRQIIKDPEIREALEQKQPAIVLDKVQEYLLPDGVDQFVPDPPQEIRIYPDGAAVE